MALDTVVVTLWAMSTVRCKLKRLATVLVIVEVIVFTFWFNGICPDGLNSCQGKLQIWPPTLNDSFALLPSLPEKRRSRASLSSDVPLQVYIYDDIPSYMTAKVLEPCVLNSRLRNVPKKIDNFMADVSIIRLFETYPGRTYNPHEADVFVVPYPHKTHCICNLNTTYEKTDNHCPQVPKSDIHMLISGLKYYNQTSKRRHLFIASGDHGWNNVRLESQPLVLTLGPKPEHKHGSIVIPYLNSRPEYQPSVLREQEWNFENRKFAFAYFFGEAKPRVNRPLFRQAVSETYGSTIGGLPFRMQKIKEWTPLRQDYVFETYRQSIFCPCLPGDNAPQKRFFDVIMSGCLPVVLSFNQSRVEGQPSWFKPSKASVRASYPFANGLFEDNKDIEIDYESFVVQVPENVSNIKPTMEALLANPRELKRRQQIMANYAPLLTYGTGKDAHKYDDAFVRILKVIRHYLNGLDNKTSPVAGVAVDETDQADSDTEQVMDESGMTDSSGVIAEVVTETGVDRAFLPGGPKTSPRPQLTDRLLNRFIVVPERKLLFCYVEKVGCSMFNHLFRMLRLSLPEVMKNVPEASFQANFTWYRNTPRHHGLNKAQLENLMIDPNWTKAVFYRDPVSRFLSAYRSKCEPGHDTTPDCKRVFSERFVSFDQALERMKKGMPKNPHFAPASEFCGGLGSTLDYYDVVHELNGETAPVHVEALLRKVGVKAEMAQSLVDAIVRTRGTNEGNKNEQLAAQLGVNVGVGRTQNEGHNTESNKQLCDYYNTPEKLSLIENLFSVDYKTFKFVPRHVNCTFQTAR